jgi:hypothetical protein
MISGDISKFPLIMSELLLFITLKMLAGDEAENGMISLNNTITHTTTNTLLRIAFPNINLISIANKAEIVPSSDKFINTYSRSFI